MRPLHRYDAHALIVPGEYAGIVDGRAGLLRLVLSDDGPLTDADSGREYTRRRVLSPDRPPGPPARRRQARQLADRLTQLADQLTATTSLTRTTPSAPTRSTSRFASTSRSCV